MYIKYFCILGILGAVFLPLTGRASVQDGFQRFIDQETLQSQSAFMPWKQIAFIVDRGSFTQDTNFSMQEMGAFPAARFPALPKHYESNEMVYQVSVDQISQKDVRIRYYYLNEKKEHRFHTLFFLPKNGRTWQPLHTVVNTERNYMESILPAQEGMVIRALKRSKIQQPVQNFSFYPYSGVQYSDTAAVMDMRTGSFLYREEATKQRPIASLSKILTSLIFLEADPNLEEIISYDRAQDQIGTHIDLAQGDQLRLMDVLMGTLIESANNMAATLSVHAGMTSEAFMARANVRLRELGLKRTYMEEPTGLNAENVSTAGNIARLARAAFQKYPDMYGAAAAQSTYQFSLKNIERAITLYSTNKFDGKGAYSVAAFKTGYLPDTAHRTLAIQLREEATGREILVVLLGNPEYNTIFQEAYDLAGWTFAQWTFSAPQ